MRYPNVASRLFGQPLAIAPGKLHTIVHGLGPRLLGSAWDDEDEVPERERRPYAVGPDGVALIAVHGVLVQRGGWCSARSEALTGYDTLAATVDQAVADPAVRAILLDVDSPGGEVAGIRVAVDSLRAARRQKPLWAVANEAAYSAAYWLASAAEQLWLPETAGVGSIGVIAVHLDQSGADRQDGLAYTAVYSGARKNDFSAHEPLGDEARAMLQAECDRVRGLFAADVASGRGLAADAVLASEAGIFTGPAALEQRLADRIGRLDEARAALAQRVSTSPAPAGPAAPGARSAGPAAATPNAGSSSMNTADAPAPDRGAGTEAAAPDAAAIAQARQAGAAEALAYVAEVNQLCALAGAPDRALAFIEAGTPVAGVRKALLEARAAATDADPVSSHRPPPRSGQGDRANNFGWDAIARRAGAHRYTTREA